MWPARILHLGSSYVSPAVTGGSHCVHLNTRVCLGSWWRPTLNLNPLDPVVQAANSTLLKFMPNEDVSIGFWLMSVDLRRIDHHRVPHHPRSKRI